MAAPDKTRSIQMLKFGAFPLAVFALLFCLFDFNAFETANPQWYAVIGHDAESAVLGRLAASRQEGIASHGGLLGHYAQEQSDFAPEFELQFNTYMNGITPSRWVIYPPQIGFQGMIYALVDKLLPPSEGNFTLFQAFASATTAAAITGVILWIMLEIGFAGAIFATLSLFYAPWLVVFGHNFYFILGTFFLPMLVTAFGFRRLHKQKNPAVKKLMSLLFAVFFVRFGCGYEFITTIVAAAWAPTVFYAVRDRWPLKRFVRITLIMAAISVAAFVLAFFLDMTMLTVAQGGDYATAFRTILSHAEVRLGTPLLDSQKFIDSSLIENPQSMEASALTVLGVYERGYIDGPQISDSVFDWPLTFGDVTLLAVALCGFILWRTWKKQTPHARMMLGATAMLGACFAATQSWHIVGHQHSFIHRHINFLLWYIPYMLLFAALLGQVVVDAVRHAPEPKTARPKKSTKKRAAT